MAAKDISYVYASSLVEIGQEKKNLPEIEEELRSLSDLVTESSELRQFLGSPNISKDVKKDFITKVFGGKLSEYMINFLFVLIDNDRQSLIVDINNSLVGLTDELNNRQRVTIIASEALKPDLKNKITKELTDKLKKEIILHEEIHESILGGIIIRMGDMVIDGSLSKDLKNIRKNLLNSKVRSEVGYED